MWVASSSQPMARIENMLALLRVEMKAYQPEMTARRTPTGSAGAWPAPHRMRMTLLHIVHLARNMVCNARAANVYWEARPHDVRSDCYRLWFESQKKGECGQDGHVRHAVAVSAEGEARVIASSPLHGKMIRVRTGRAHPTIGHVETRIPPKKHDRQ